MFAFGERREGEYILKSWSAENEEGGRRGFGRQSDSQSDVSVSDLTEGQGGRGYSRLKRHLQGS